MKITSVSVFQTELPYPGVYKLSGGREYRFFTTTVVKVETDLGLIGWGESCPFGGNYIEAHSGGVLAAVTELAPEILGLEPSNPVQIYSLMDEVLVGQAAAKSAIDMALWDLAGKVAGLPVCDLIGGRLNVSVPAISSISSGTPEEMSSSVQEHRKRGFTHHSIKIGALEKEGGPALDAERIQASLGDRKHGEFFLVDANGGLTLEHARHMFELLPSELEFVLEAPCATWGETLKIKDISPFPIMMDELVQSDGDVALAIQLNICDALNLKLGKQGGITRCVTQRDLAKAGKMSVSIQDTWGAEISLAAILHVAASTNSIMLRGALDTRPLVEVELADIDVGTGKGGLKAPTLPGLGIDPKIDVLGESLKTWTL